MTEWTQIVPTIFVSTHWKRCYQFVLLIVTTHLSIAQCVDIWAVILYPWNENNRGFTWGYVYQNDKICPIDVKPWFLNPALRLLSRWLFAVTNSKLLPNISPLCPSTRAARASVLTDGIYPSAKTIKATISYLLKYFIIAYCIIYGSR